MRPTIPRAAVVAAACLASACSTIRVQVPERLGEQGLVVAHVATGGALGSPLNAYDSDADPVIDGKRYDGGLRDGFLIVPLPPGEHTLEALRETLGSYTSYSGGVRMTTTTIGTLPINRRFTVKAGQVTNLGLLLFVDSDAPGAKPGSFYTFAVDNRADMQRYLKTRYPSLAASASVDAMTLADGKYLSGDLLERVRRLLVSQALKSHENRWIEQALADPARRNGPFVVAGAAGTLAELRRQPDGRMGIARLLPSPTLSAVRSAAYDAARGRYAFTTADRRLFVVQGGQVSERPMPGDLVQPRVHFAGDATLILTEGRRGRGVKFAVSTSVDDGATWQPFTATRTGHYQGSFVKPAAGGYYVYAVYYDLGGGPAASVAFYSRRGSGAYEPVSLPADLAAPLGGLEERGGTLYLWTTGAKSPSLFVRPAGGAWERRALPAGYCDLTFADDRGARILGSCGGKHFETTDGGRSWHSASAPTREPSRS